MASVKPQKKMMLDKRLWDAFSATSKRINPALLADFNRKFDELVWTKAPAPFLKFLKDNNIEFTLNIDGSIGADGSDAFNTTQILLALNVNQDHRPNNINYTMNQLDVPFVPPKPPKPQRAPRSDAGAQAPRSGSVSRAPRSALDSRAPRSDAGARDSRGALDSRGVAGAQAHGEIPLFHPPQSHTLPPPLIRIHPPPLIRIHPPPLIPLARSEDEMSVAHALVEPDAFQCRAAKRAKLDGLDEMDGLYDPSESDGLNCVVFPDTTTQFWN